MRSLLASLLILSLLVSPIVKAADNAAPKTRDEMLAKGLRRQLRTILLGGLAGGAIGLSTLSFYGRPQEKLTYIPAGIGVGLIVGTIVSTSQLVNNPQDLMSENFEPPARGQIPIQADYGLRWAVSF